mgnify:CR=1 FL=1
MKTIAMAITLATLGISMAQATSASSTGRITFSGAIVEDACRINQLFYRRREADADHLPLRPLTNNRDS